MTTPTPDERAAWRQACDDRDNTFPYVLTRHRAISTDDFIRLLDALEQAERERDEARADVDLTKVIAVEHQFTSVLVEENWKMQDALEWYADIEHYVSHTETYHVTGTIVYGEDYAGDVKAATVEADQGARARQALGEAG